MLTGASCAVAQTEGPAEEAALAGDDADTAIALRPAETADVDVEVVVPAPVLGPIVGPMTPEPPVEIQLGAQRPALTEKLDTALDRLAEAEAANQTLRDTAAALEQKLAERDKTVGELTAQLDTYGERIKSVEASLRQWQEDVLGFRDEMRDYEEAEIEVLQQIVQLLKGFKKETQGE
ncbi:MAG: hypothetical protein AMK73_00880 [Planctomycetes bacterium SM23_32]|nr:MAG: hypothetical protein AMK73_00880 [Planctomycetes bacterium SM23_32]